MVDWRSSMQQSFEFYTVDPGTWKDVKLLDNVTSCTINRDSDAETLGSATIDIIESVGECYIRVYLITIQNGIREKHPLGTYLVQTPTSSFNGKVRNVSMDAYTPLLELKEKMPAIGYTIPKKTNVMEIACDLVAENLRAPVVKATSDRYLFVDFVADPNDTMSKFLTDLIANADFKFDLDEMGRVLFAPKQEAAAMTPVWTYDDGNSSILCPDLSMDHDLYGIPNVVEVIYSNNSRHQHVVVKNDDPNSPTSTISRGREIVHRVMNPDLNAVADIDDPIDGSFILTEDQVKEYATKLLKDLSTIEYSISYSHGYCPVRVGDCVRLNYTKAGLTDVKAKVVSQTIKCSTGCQVSEKAVFTTKLWR